MKHEYVLKINALKGETISAAYDYGKTKGIKTEVSEQGIRITASMGVSYDKEDILESPLFADALKKALLLHYIRFSRGLTVKNIIVQINGKEEAVSFKDTELLEITSVIPDDKSALKKGLPSAWTKKETIDGILKQTKSKYDSRTAALFSLIFAKSREYEMERFIYLWTSFNGIQGYFLELIEKANAGKNYRAVKEIEKINYFCKYLGILDKDFNNDKWTNLPNKTKTETVYGVMRIIRESDTDGISKRSLQSGKHKGMAEKIKQTIKEKSGLEMQAYKYIVADFAYYFRNNIFHASKPILLFSNAKELQLKYLKTVNALLEELLEDELHKWFIESTLKNEIAPEARKIRLPLKKDKK